MSGIYDRRNKEYKELRRIAECLSGLAKAFGRTGNQQVSEELWAAIAAQHRIVVSLEKIDSDQVNMLLSDARTSAAVALETGLTIAKIREKANKAND